MEQYLTAQMLNALAQGDWTRFVGFVLIFFVIWSEVRGLKKEMTKINKTLEEKLTAGEMRFEKLEKKDLDIEHRLTVLEQHTT